VEEIAVPRPLAPAFLFGNNNLFPVDIVASVPTTLLVIFTNSFLQLMQKNPLVLSRYLDSISNRAQFLSNRLYFLSFKTLKEKLAQYILQHAQPDANTVILEKTQHELAEYFAVSRPSLARTLRDLKLEGLIMGRGRQLSILDRGRLESLSIQ
jgi:CRP-like cAMP-binding protein